MPQATPLIEPQNDDRDTSPPRPQSAANSEKESANIKRSPRRSAWLDSWLFIWITLVFSIACFIAIAIVLYVYDGGVRPDMPHRISLNTIVSVLGTGCRSSLILAVGEAISQLKWLWFQEPPNNQGQLAGMQRFDAASKGPLGSLLIIFHHRACSLVSLGAGVVVLLLAFDPFLQQLIDYPVRSTIDSNPDTAHAIAPQLREYIPPENARSDLDYAMSQGIFSSHEDFKVDPSCSSGNCTWESFSSVGICNRCSNMTDTAKLECDLETSKSARKSCKITLPGDFFYEFNIVQNANVSSPEIQDSHFPNPIFWQPFSFDFWMEFLRTTGKIEHPLPVFPNATLAGVRNPLLGFVYIELKVDDRPTSPNASALDQISIKNATACSLSTCLRDYDIRVDNGSPSIETSNIDFGTRYVDPFFRDYLPYPRLCWMPGPPDPDGYKSSEDFPFCDREMSLLENTRFYFPSPKNQTFVWDSLNGTAGSYTLLTAINSQAEWDGANGKSQLNRIGFERTMSNIAASSTKFGLQKTNNSIKGTVHVANVFVDVRWPWLILPGILVIIGTVFLVITTIISKRSHASLWKSSALAPYYHGIEDIDENDRQYPTSSAMDKSAETEHFRLRRSENNRKLILLRQQEKRNTTEMAVGAQPST